MTFLTFGEFGISNDGGAMAAEAWTTGGCGVKGWKEYEFLQLRPDAAEVNNEADSERPICGQELSLDIDGEVKCLTYAGLGQDSDSFGQSPNCNEQGVSQRALGPPEGFLFALPYVGLQSLLNLERVSKSLRESVRSDALLWQHLHVEPPSSKKLTDDALVKLSERAQGRLQCLSLKECLRISEAGVERVLIANPMLSKLSLPGCTKISPEAIVRMVQTHNASCQANGLTGLKQLRIRGVYGVTREHLEVLTSLLQPDHEKLSVKPLKPQFYRNGHHIVSCDYERAIDMEACPKCGNARVVYDCTRARCQQQKSPVPGLTCRGCIFCIARCEECGTCINDMEFEETFCLDFLCSSCWLRLPKCSECNKASCGRHADHVIRSTDSAFTCENCRAGAAGPEFPGEYS